MSRVPLLLSREVDKSRSIFREDYLPFIVESMAPLSKRDKAEVSSEGEPSTEPEEVEQRSQVNNEQKVNVTRVSSLCSFVRSFSFVHFHRRLFRAA